MTSALLSVDNSLPPPNPRRAVFDAEQLPPAIAAAIWHANELGSAVSTVLSTGFDPLDLEFPGGGWPCHALSEVLQPQPSLVEWRLLGPAMRQVVASGRDVVVVGPAQRPHLAGLQHVGVDERHLVWIRADSPSERLWVTEQLVKANACGMLVAWLPQARQEQIRRLQVCAQACDGPVILCRPAAAEHEASAAPLRVQVSYGVDWELHVHVLKRRGAVHEGLILLPSVPGGLEEVLTPRIRRPSVLIAQRKQSDAQTLRPAQQDAVGSPPPRLTVVRPVSTH
jgi:protein ImuA